MEIANAQITALDARMIAAGYTLGDACCIHCGNVWVEAVKPETQLTRLLCPICQKQCSLFYEFQPTVQAGGKNW